MIELKVDGLHVLAEPIGSIVGTAKVSLPGVSFMVKIINGNKGIFIAVPSIWNKQKSEYENAIFLEQEAYEKMTTLVKAKYEEKVSVGIPSGALVGSVPVVGNRTPEKTVVNPQGNSAFDDDIPF